MQTLAVIVAIGFIMAAVYFSTGSNNGGGSTTSAFIDAFARGIARAEGYYDRSTLPYKQNNPGAMKNSQGVIATYSTPDEGWNALKRQLMLIVDGKSSYYRLSMSIYDMALVWTGGDKSTAWAGYVATELGVSPETTIGSAEMTWV